MGFDILFVSVLALAHFGLVQDNSEVTRELAP
jgi:hypothetical protein